MEVNDYIQIGKQLKQVQEVFPPQGKIIDIKTGKISNTILTSCYIGITLDTLKDILEACGFSHDSSDNSFYIELNKETQNSHYKVSVPIRVFPKYKIEKYSYTEDESYPKEKDICCLSVLQDWIREETGMELKIDEQKLADIVSK